MKHRAADCRSKRTSSRYKDKLHLSLWKQSCTMVVVIKGSVFYTLVVVKVNNITRYWCWEVLRLLNTSGEVEHTAS